MIIPKVLVVNDNPASLVAYVSILTGGAERNEYEIVTAASGEEALRHVLKHDFAVVLLDVNMPRMNGFETAEAIHSRPRSASLPIIFLTAHFADEMHRIQGYQMGAVDYVFTPVVSQILQAKVAVFVELARQKLELQREARELARLNRVLQVQRVRDLERINAELQVEIAERKQAEQRAYELSIRDALTGLLNRRPLLEHLEHAIAYSARHKQLFALLFLDLNGFKTINDTFGHDAGDELLVRVAASLQNTVREADIVARLGGDEFVVLLKGIAAAAEAAQVAQKVAEAVARPFKIGGKCVSVEASIGISMYPQDGTTALALIKNADMAMYQGKNPDQGSIRFFSQDMNPVL
jgi:diguanylate cyclase (GGDEF)-like protein